jgi:hypothetical protein
MAGVKFYFEGEQIGPKFQRKTRRDGERVRKAIREGSADAAEEMVKKGRENIAGAGRFGTRWTEGLTAPVTEGGGNIKIDLKHTISYFMVHQRGATIRGRPWLYIPYKAEQASLVKGSRPGVGGLAKVRQVVIPKRFRVIEIALEIARRMQQFYNKRLKSDG